MQGGPRLRRVEAPHQDGEQSGRSRLYRSGNVMDTAAAPGCVGGMGEHGVSILLTRCRPPPPPRGHSPPPAAPQNPDYKGKWSAPMVDNPAYKGVWAPKQIKNPDYFVDEAPLTHIGKVGAAAIEVWSMDDGFYFDNIVVSNSEAEATAVLEKTLAAKNKAEVRSGGCKPGLRRSAALCVCMCGEAQVQGDPGCVVLFCVGWARCSWAGSSH